MASKFGGVPVESTSKFGGIPLEGDQGVTTEVESTYKNLPGSWNDFVGALLPGIGKTLPGQTLLHETEPRVIFEEKKDFMPLLGRIPGIGKYLVPSGAQDIPAFVWAPPGTEEAAREKYPTANIQQLPEEDRDFAIKAREKYEQSKGTTAGRLGLGTGDVIGELIKMAAAGSVTPSALHPAAKGAIMALPGALRSAEGGKYGEALGKEAIGAGTVWGLNALLSKVAHLGYPKELIPIMKKMESGGASLSDAETSILKATQGVLESLPEKVSYGQLAAAYKAAGLGSPVSGPIQKAANFMAEHPKLSGMGAGALTSGGLELARGGDAMSTLRSTLYGGALGGLKGTGALSGSLAGSLPSILRAIMAQGMQPSDATGDY